MSVPTEIDRVAVAANLPTLSPAATRFRNIIILASTGVLIEAVLHWDSPDLIKYLVVFGTALGVSAARAVSPSGFSTLSAALLLILFGVADLNRSEAVFLAGCATLLPALWRRYRTDKATDPMLDTSLIVTATSAACRIYTSATLIDLGMPVVARFASAVIAMFLIQSVAQLALVAFDRSRSVAATWLKDAAWTAPYFAAAATLAYLMHLASAFAGWETVVAAAPVVYLIYRSYRLYAHRLEDQRVHAEEMAALHLRTIQALALAIEAKDHATHDHLQRVQVYAREMAKELGLTSLEVEALQAASLLHDIGKLAVPEHIISKPGRLTPEEFDKMKIHPTVGAEILERVRFPYPVAPIVRAHHEKWDGTGYPNGLRGEAIPIGARILSAVDCLDALASDRQYRRALPLDEAIKVVESESGKAFDPRVVEVLKRRYVDLERMASGTPAPRKGKLSTEVKVELGAAPAAGFESVKESSAGSDINQPVDFLTSIAAARQEVQTLFEISQDLGNSLSLDETLSVLNVRLRRIIPHHTLAIWLRKDDILTPAYVNGEDYRLFSSLEIPVGQGLSGWVVENGKPIVNGNPTVESGYLNDPTLCSTLRSAVAVPLEGNGRIMGVLALYHLDRDAFTRDNLRILSAINTKIGMAIENALRFRQVESTATTDYMTSLPNARSLFLQLDSELARAKRADAPLTVVVLDMDGLKAINDRFGHLEGNRVLGQVAAGLKAACRDYDYVARMGGDEFVVMLPGLRAADTEARIETLRQVVASAGVGLFTDRTLTASLGLASYPADGNDAETILSEADRRMYKEKQLRKEARNLVPKNDWQAQLTAIHNESNQNIAILQPH